MKQAREYISQRFFYLRVKGFENGKFLVRCACGKQGRISRHLLLSGHKQSCGCLPDLLQENPTIEYQRIALACHFPPSLFYGYYRVKICQRWRYNNKHFVDDLGYRPLGHKLVRLDPNKNFSPENCRYDRILNDREQRIVALFDEPAQIRGQTSLHRL